MPTRRRIEKFVWERAIRPALFLLNAERAHRWTLAFFAVFEALRVFPVVWLLKKILQSRYANMDMHLRIENFQFRNLFWIPAGLLKNGWAIWSFDRIFRPGVIVIGTGTPNPQPGNPGLRLWRKIFVWFEGNVRKSSFVMANRLGFNSDGWLKISLRLRRAIRRGISASLVLSIGPNKIAVDDRPEAPDYIDRLVEHILDGPRVALKILRKEIQSGRAPHIAVEANVSSPNTEGLRKVFFQLNIFCEKFYCGMKKICHDLDLPMPVLILKIPPDNFNPLEAIEHPLITDDQLEKIIEAAAPYFHAISGVNTTIHHRKISRKPMPPLELPQEWQGGISGDILYPVAVDTMKRLVFIIREKKSRLKVIAGGGIGSAEQALAFFALDPEIIVGVFALTNLVYNPWLPDEITRTYVMWKRTQPWPKVKNS